MEEEEDDEDEDDDDDDDLLDFLCFGGGLVGSLCFLLVFFGFDDSLAAFFELFLAVSSGSGVG